MLGRFEVDGRCRPYLGNIPNNVKYKIWFNRGGAQHFEHVYNTLLIRSRQKWDYNRMMFEVRSPAFMGTYNSFGQCADVSYLAGAGGTMPMGGPSRAMSYGMMENGYGMGGMNMGMGMANGGATQQQNMMMQQQMMQQEMLM
mmetsp:Transcript_41648/g.56574  ORF Transcript_41648/g.56574 Transcript_41648/m.56574 type:complete len:142 (-) Transcript_41648:160-585(-)